MKAEPGANSALLSWEGDPKATYLVIGREQGSKTEVKRSHYPVKGSEFLDSGLENSTFEYKVQQIDGSGKMLTESNWVAVSPHSSGGHTVWAIYPPGDPDEPFDTGAVTLGDASKGRVYVDGAYYGPTTASEHKTNPHLHYAMAKIDPAGWAAGEHSLVITVPAPRGGFAPSLRIYVKTAGGGPMGGVPAIPLVGGVVGVVALIALVVIAKKPKVA